MNRIDKLRAARILWGTGSRTDSAHALILVVSVVGPIIYLAWQLRRALIEERRGLGP